MCLELQDSSQNKLSSDSYSSFVSQALSTARTNTAIFVNKNFSGTLKPTTLTRTLSVASLRSPRDRPMTTPTTDRSHHIFMPYFGGSDGRVALRLLLQLAENPEITATIVFYPGTAEDSSSQDPTGPAHLHRTFSTEDDAAFYMTMQRSLDQEIESRILFETASASSSPSQDAATRAQTEVGQNPRNAGDIIIVGRNAQPSQTMSSSSCLGSAANAILGSNVNASLLVIQARGSGP